MDRFTAMEESYKNGYERGFTDAAAIINQDGDGKHVVGHKLSVLLGEAIRHPDGLNKIADEIPWYVIVGVVHRLKRKRRNKM